MAVEQNGPVHINVPFDEPLYETTNKLIVSPFKRTLNLTETEEDFILNDFTDIWNSASRKIILIGAHYPDELLQQQLNTLINDESVLVFTETTSNVHHPKFINSIDKLLFPIGDDDFEVLKPEVLVTLGGMVVSKRVKQFLRKYKPNHHWHVDQKNAPDTYHSLTKHFRIKPTTFFDKFNKKIKPIKSAYQQNWLTIKAGRNNKHDEFVKDVKFSDFKVIGTILSKIPNNILLQLGNSSVIRYVQLFENNHSIDVFCNRGTSGIDGSTSTAIGAATISKNQTVFITGDISFFYDSNALWNNYMPNNFRIIIMNNSGGGIFKILPGPKKTNALDYFETKHELTAEHLCKMHQLEYSKVVNELELSNALTCFFDDSDQPKLLEIFTPSNINDEVLKDYFKSIQ
ncbi:UNVERIFIED_CONTAM: hypothetical protein GTU68_032358 [Idotea baltica]|nr:hypothetical protein [Idotea baltica]